MSSNHFKRKSDNQIFVYYGGAYTQPHSRGKGIHTQLIVESLKMLQLKIIERLSNFVDKKEIVFFYGQVLANANNKGVVRTFLEFTNDLISETELKLFSTFQHYTYKAVKPSFKFDEIANKLEVSFPKENRGVANLIVFKVRKE